MFDAIPWVESPLFEEMLEKSSYSEQIKEKIRFYHQNGYLILEDLIEGFDQKAKNIISSLSEEQQKFGSRVQDAWRYVPDAKALACHPKILEWLQILYQRKPIPFQTLNFSKGTEQATHSDLIHFNTFPKRYMAGVWFALEDVDADNGPLHYYPGSHTLPIYELSDLGMPKSTLANRQEQYQRYEAFIRGLIANSSFKKELINIKKGSCLIWAANLLHGGEKINDPTRSRHTQVTHYYFEGCRYYNPLYSDLYLGDVAWKKIIDIETGKTVDHIYNGKKVSLPLKTHTRYFIENLMRNNPLGRTLLTKAKKFLTAR